MKSVLERFIRGISRYLRSHSSLTSDGSGTAKVYTASESPNADTPTISLFPQSFAFLFRRHSPPPNQSVRTEGFQVL
jgi:hypothetical protein